uniref:Reverse transcriptase domain-containing protein n=1 Tax=Amphimedon queenslandica TaxID=400682 RepID=A0A1X7V5Q9_AMPQE
MEGQINNYRPISLLCTISKVLERIIFDKIVDFVQDHISSSQFGFLKGKSSQQQLLILLHHIHSNIEKKYTSGVIYLDLRKAFDSVVHGILLTKLESIGISGHLLRWFHAYLSDRYQCVSINNSVSDLLSVLSVFIILFADDTKCIHTTTDHSSSLSSVSFQCDLDALCQWSLNNGIHFNDSKSVTMKFLSAKGQAQSPSYFLNSKPIPTAISHRDLGVILSSTLSWDDHIIFITSKAYKSLGLIRRTFSSTLPIHIKKQLYLSMVWSQLLYCSIIWRPNLIKHIIMLERIQRRATKYILNDYTSDYKSRLIALDLLPLSMVIEIADITFFLKSLHSPSHSSLILPTLLTLLSILWITLLSPLLTLAPPLNSN